jgi:alkylhydroperoxidase family enzyme
MAKLLHEIEWGEPLLKLGSASDLSEVQKLSPWLAASLLAMSARERVVWATPALMNIAYFVACQENQCRFCYGLTRALMKIWGYTERQIQDLEHEAALADGVTRQVVEFSRKLAKSNPSPARGDYEALLEKGLSAGAVSEIAGCVAKACFANRMSTFLALAPDALEKVPDTFFGKISGFFIRRGTWPRRVPPLEGFRNEGPYAPIVAVAGETPMAEWLRGLTDGWLGSEAIPRRSKAIMMAVIARQLGSGLCEVEARAHIVAEGLAPADVDMILSTLSSPRLTAMETRLLRWTRETVWYEPRVIQESTRRLLGEVGARDTLEAVGSAAVCNSLARLSLVRQ